MILVAILLFVGHLSVLAHEKMLNIGYDDCIAENVLDGKDETCLNGTLVFYDRDKLPVTQ